MKCANLNRRLDTEKVKALVSKKYRGDNKSPVCKGVAAFVEEHCIKTRTYHNWMSGSFQPPIGFYLLLVDTFGGAPEDYTIAGSVDAVTD